jgi:hypothetical protein
MQACDNRVWLIRQEDTRDQHLQASRQGAWEGFRQARRLGGLSSHAAQCQHKERLRWSYKVDLFSFQARF